jgi:hypothetical protein
MDMKSLLILDGVIIFWMCVFYYLISARIAECFDKLLHIQHSLLTLKEKKEENEHARFRHTK